MNDFTKRVMLMRDAGVVKRSHTCRTLMDRNVAEHSHGVAMLALLIYASEGAVAPGNVLSAALCHDLSEIATGDVPAPVKRDNPSLRAELNAISTKWEQDHGIRFELSREEQDLLLWCDRMDFALYALEEVNMGNKLFKPYLNRIVYWLSTMHIPTFEGKAPYAASSLFAGVYQLASEALGHSINEENPYGN